MKNIEFHAILTKIMKILEFYMTINKKNANLIIPIENHETNENRRILIENN